MDNHVVETPYRVELRERILHSAAELFAAHGIKGITMDQIAASLVISKRTLYEIFSDKEELLKECLLKHQEEMHAYVTEVFNSSANVLEVILKLYQRSIEEFHRTNRRFFDDIKRYPKVWEILKSSKHKDAESTMAFFRMGVEQGIFRDDVNFAIVNKQVELQLHLLIDSDLAEEYSFLEVYESIMLIWIRGISTAKGAQILEEFVQEYRKKQNNK